MRDSLPTKTKINESGILNLDSSSGDGTHWIMWFKKGKDMFYFDCYGVQHPSELITYLKSPLFYNSEYFFALKLLSLGNNIHAVINYLI